MEKKKITHIITGLNGGGAETMLYKLLENADRKKYEIQVISMLDKGVFGDLIEKNLSIPVFTLNLNKKTSLLKALPMCIKLCISTDIIQGWMYHANLLAYFIGKILFKRIIWGLHHNDLSIEGNKKRTIRIAKLGAKLSRSVDKVISCGENVKSVHLGIGYSKTNNIVIPNGFDTSVFSPSRAYGDIRELFNIDNNKKIIIHVGRWHPLKDYKNLIGCIANLKTKREDFTLLMVGTDINSSNQTLVNMINESKIQDKVQLLGRRNDIPNLMAAADFFISSSSGEGFPNVIGEAMASGAYCIVTDAGDSGYIVGSYGKVVPIKKPKELSETLNEVMDMPKEKYSTDVKNARKRVIDNFEIKVIAKSYEQLY